MSMTYAITVEPAELGWVVRGQTLENELQFLSGAKAETAARSLAARMAAGGQATEIQIFLRDGTLAQRVQYGGVIA
jgi:hypothetical protein